MTGSPNLLQSSPSFAVAAVTRRISMSGFINEATLCQPFYLHTDYIITTTSFNLKFSNSIDQLEVLDGDGSYGQSISWDTIRCPFHSRFSSSVTEAVIVFRLSVLPFHHVRPLFSFKHELNKQGGIRACVVSNASQHRKKPNG